MDRPLPQNKKALAQPKGPDAPGAQTQLLAYLPAQALLHGLVHAYPAPWQVVVVNIWLLHGKEQSVMHKYPCCAEIEKTLRCGKFNVAAGRDSAIFRDQSKPLRQVRKALLDKVRVNIVRRVPKLQPLKEVPAAVGIHPVKMPLQAWQSAPVQLH